MKGTSQQPPQDKVVRTRRMRAKNKSGTVTYIVQTTNDQQNKLKQAQSNGNHNENTVAHELRSIQIEQEKVVALLENMADAAKKIDYKILDELNSVECESASVLKEYLNSIEMLAFHWQMVKKDKYQYRIANHGQLDIYINEIPRATNEGKIFNIKTFVLSCKTPYMKTKDGTKVFISKEYSNAAGKLHLNFYMLHDLIVRELNQKLELIAQSNSRGSIMAFFKTLFSSSGGGQDNCFHPLFRETALLKKIKKSVKIFELCVRNFEETYIHMIKDLQDKTFKINVDSNQETSIIMKRREQKNSQDQLQKQCKIVDNQMFDFDGNILTSLKNSFNQSMMLCGSVNSRIGSEYTQSVVANNGFQGVGPQAHISPVPNLRKAHHDESIKPTSSSQGPSSRLQHTISPSLCSKLPSHQNPNRNNNNNLSRSSRNSGFRPLQSLQNIDSQNGFRKQQEYVGSVISTSSQPLMMSQALINIQKKTISPQIIKHNYRPLQNTSNDELVVKYVDMNDDKENVFQQSNITSGKPSNFAFQTPNPNNNLIKNKLMATQTTGCSTTPGQNMSSLVGTIIQRNSNLMQEYPQSSNALKTKDLNCEIGQVSGPFDQVQYVGCQADTKAYYKNMIVNNKRVIKTSRNLFNNEGSATTSDNVKDMPYQQPRISLKGNYSEQQTNNYLMMMNSQQQQKHSKQQVKDQTENSFDQSSCNSDSEDDLSQDGEERNQINQSSMMRATRSLKKPQSAVKLGLKVQKAVLKDYSSLLDQSSNLLQKKSAVIGGTTKETASTHRSANQVKLKTNNQMCNLRVRQVGVQSTKNNQRRESAITSHSQNTSRSISKDKSNQRLKKNSHVRQKSDKIIKKQPITTTNKSKKIQQSFIEEPKIKRKNFIIPSQVDEKMKFSISFDEGMAQKQSRPSMYDPEYRDLQQQLLQAKTELYEQIYEKDIVNQKYQKLKQDYQQFKQQLDHIQQDSRKFYERYRKYKQMAQLKDVDCKKLKDQCQKLIEEKNDHIEDIRDKIDQQMREFFIKSQNASMLGKDMTTRLGMLQKLVSEERNLQKSRQINQAIMDVILIGDKIFENMRINDCSNGHKLSTIEEQSYYLNQANQSIDENQQHMDIHQENSLFQMQNNRFEQDNIQKGEYQVDGKQQAIIDQQMRVIEDMKQQMERIAHENKNLLDERESFVQQLQKLENSQRSQEKIMHFMNQQNQQQQSSFQSNPNCFSTNQDPKQGSAFMMGPLLLSETDKHFTNPTNIKNQTIHYQNYQAHHSKLDANFIQSDPGMQFFINGSSIDKRVTEDNMLGNFNQNETFQENRQFNEGSNGEREPNGKVPPLLVLKEINDYANVHSGPSSSIRTGLTSTTNQGTTGNANGFKTAKFQVLSPTSTLSMQHIQLPNFRSPLASNTNNNTSNFTLSQNPVNQQLYSNYDQHYQQNNGQWSNYQQNMQQVVFEGKASHRSHETSTFQQHQEFLESLKEVGEENEDDQDMIESKNRNFNSIGKQRQNRYDYISNYEANQSQIDNKRKTSNSPQNKENLSSSFYSNQFESIPVLGKERLSQQYRGKDTITTSSQILSDRTFNLKKEINSLDDEILQLQNSLHNALAKRNINQ